MSVSYRHPRPSSDRADASNRVAGLLALGRPLVMGVLNVTPNSFSDGGHFLDPQDAMDQLRRMVAQGADIAGYRRRIDPSLQRSGSRVGGRGNSPAQPVLPQRPSSASHIHRYHEGRRCRLGARRGASIVNDVWGLQRDCAMARLAAESRAPVIIMHNRERADPSLDIMADIARFFTRSLEIAEAAGVERRNIVLDPGIGFGKTPEQSRMAIARFARAAIVRPTSSCRRLAQAFHCQGVACPA